MFQGRWEEPLILAPEGLGTGLSAGMRTFEVVPLRSLLLCALCLCSMGAGGCPVQLPLRWVGSVLALFLVAFRV